MGSAHGGCRAGLALIGRVSLLDLEYIANSSVGMINSDFFYALEDRGGPQEDHPQHFASRRQKPPACSAPKLGHRDWYQGWDCLVCGTPFAHRRQDARLATLAEFGLERAHKLLATPDAAAEDLDTVGFAIRCTEGSEGTRSDDGDRTAELLAQHRNTPPATMAFVLMVWGRRERAIREAALANPALPQCAAAMHMLDPTCQDAAAALTAVCIDDDEARAWGRFAVDVGVTDRRFVDGALARRA